jgi:hypothetical protein
MRSHSYLLICGSVFGLMRLVLLGWGIQLYHWLAIETERVSNIQKKKKKRVNTPPSNSLLLPCPFTFGMEGGDPFSNKTISANPYLS